MRNTKRKIYIFRKKTTNCWWIKISIIIYNGISKKKKKKKKLLDNAPNQLSKFRTKKWIEINYQSRGVCNVDSETRFKSTMLKSIIAMHTYFHCVKSVRIRSYSDPFFSRIFPHSDWIRPYSVRMRENAGKMQIRITLNTDPFYVVFFKKE